METPWRMSGLVATLAALLVVTVHAGELAACFEAAGERYDIAPALLQAIARAESSLDPWAMHVNAGGTVDVGLMQINSWWFPVLKQHGIQPQDLWDPCLNIGVGAWILAGNIRQYGYDWRAVGAYNAGTRTDLTTERRREDYAIRVYRHLPCGVDRLCGDAARPD